ncbi:MAG TPA: tetratricopeptide repeat protein [Rhizomicrobium sp.]|nr:tetratricopeptide repeat protein [Rhizomicrobium sp.]
MGRLLFLLAVMSLAAATAAASPATPAMMSEILAALDKGEARQAAILSDSALKEADNSAGQRASLMLYRGLAHELLGQHEAAMRDLTAALDSRALPSEERGQALLQRGFLRDGLGRLEEAVADYSAVAALKDYNLATALNNRANIYRRQNRLREARRDYLAALSADGGQPQYSYYGLGQIAEAGHDVGAARDFYAKALIADPEYAEASRALAALGGPAEGAIAVPGERIILRPPSAQGGGSRENRARENSRENLSPPIAPPGSAAPVRHSALKGFMGGLMPVNALILRPALDQDDDGIPHQQRRAAEPLPQAGAAEEIQLGAWRSQAGADQAWDRIKARAGGMLDGLRYRIVAVDLPKKGRYFRLRVSTGAQICIGLKANGIACIAARN